MGGWGSVDGGLVGRFASEIEAITRRLSASLLLVIGDDQVGRVQPCTPGRSPGPLPAALVGALGGARSACRRGGAVWPQVGVGMSSPGRPKSDYRSAQHEGSPVSSPGRPKRDYRSAQHDGSPVSPARPPKGARTAARSAEVIP